MSQMEFRPPFAKDTVLFKVGQTWRHRTSQELAKLVEVGTVALRDHKGKLWTPAHFYVQHFIVAADAESAKPEPLVAPATQHDMKAGLTGNKPQLSQMPRHAQIHASRVMEYGSDKYKRGNYHRPAPAGVTPVDRFLGYMDACARHLSKITHEINVARGTGGDEGAACAVVDADSDGRFPASMLPDISHLLASVCLAIEVGVKDGLLPADPGRPWKDAPANPRAEALNIIGAARDKALEAVEADGFKTEHPSPLPLPSFDVSDVHSSTAEDRPAPRVPCTRMEPCNGVHCERC